MEKQDRKAPAKAKAPDQLEEINKRLRTIDVEQARQFAALIGLIDKVGGKVLDMRNDIIRETNAIDETVDRIEAAISPKAQPAPAPTGLQPGDYTDASKETADALTAMGLETLSRNTYQQGGGRYWWDGYRIANTSSYGQTYLTPSEFIARAAATAKELGLTLVKEEAWVPKVGEWVARGERVRDWPKGKLDMVLRAHSADKSVEVECGEVWSTRDGWCRPATPAEITAHLAKIEAEKPVGFGTWVEYEGERWRVACSAPHTDGRWLIVNEENFWSEGRKRSEFTVIDPQP